MINLKKPAKQTTVKTKYPLVLVHGLLVLTELWDIPTFLISLIL